MKRGDKVRVKETASESVYRGMTGTVGVDSAPGELVGVEFDAEAVSHDFYVKELELIEEFARVGRG
jgi:hypothetical protein